MICQILSLRPTGSSTPSARCYGSPPSSRAAAVKPSHIHSIWFGKRVGRNPWQGCSLEWNAPSVPGHGNFDRQVAVHRGPYEYASPEVSEDYHPQWDPA